MSAVAEGDAVSRFSGTEYLIEHMAPGPRKPHRNLVHHNKTYRVDCRRRRKQVYTRSGYRIQADVCVYSGIQSTSKEPHSWYEDLLLASDSHKLHGLAENSGMLHCPFRGRLRTTKLTG